MDGKGTGVPEENDAPGANDDPGAKDGEKVCACPWG
jgi:hypothetical protein